MRKFDTLAPIAVLASRAVMGKQMAGAVRLTATGAGCLPRRRHAGRTRRCSGSTVLSMRTPIRRRFGAVREGEPIMSLLWPGPAQASGARPVGRGSVFGSFARFVLFGGGVGLASSIAVPLVATLMPWVAANALITVASTLLGTELHARFTFGAGRRAQWHQHLQSAGSATAAYLATSAAVLVLHAVQPSASMRWEQAVYLSASALAGTGRFLVLRLYVFARSRTPGTDPDDVRPVRAGAAPGGPRPSRQPPAPDHQRPRRTRQTAAGHTPDRTTEVRAGGRPLIPGPRSRSALAQPPTGPPAPPGCVAAPCSDR